MKSIGSYKYSSDGKTLIKDQKGFNDAQQEVRNVKEVRTISNDGKVLTIEQTVSIPNATGYAVKAVYDRK